MKTSWWWAILALGLLWWTFRQAALVDIVRVFQGVRPGELLLLALVNALILLSFSARWWLFLRAQGYTLPYLTLSIYRLAAFALSYVTPGPQFGGEPLQVYLVCRRHRVPVASSVAAVALDRLLEMWVNFAFLAGGSLVVLGMALWPSAVAFRAGGVLLLLVLLPTLVLGALWRGHHPISGAGEMLLAWWQRMGRGRAEAPVRLVTLLGEVRRSEDEAIRLCRGNPRLWLAALAASFLTWGLLLGEFWLMAYVLGMALSPGQLLLALLAARVAILLPMPAALGTLEASQVLAMEHLGLGAAAGISLGVLIRARDLLLAALGLWLVVLLLGRPLTGRLLASTRQGMDWRERGWPLLRGDEPPSKPPNPA